MKSCVLESPGKLKFADNSIEDPPDDGILVKTMACGICGTDFHAYKGEHKAIEYPIVLGHEVSGIVYKTGKNIKNFKKNDRVAINPNITCGYCENCKSGNENFCENMRSVGINYPGGYSEYVTVPEKVVYKIPDEMSFEAAALAEPVSCIVHAFETANIPLGGSAVILGTGFIGLTFLQILKGMGYYPVYVMGRNKFRNELAKKYGADKIFENMDGLMQSSIVNNASLVIETTGSNDILKKTPDVVSPSGKIFAFAVYPPYENVEMDANKIYSKEISIFGDFINPYTMRKAINLIQSGLIDVNGMEDLKVDLDNADKIFTAQTKKFIKPLIVFK